MLFFILTLALRLDRLIAHPGRNQPASSRLLSSVRVRVGPSGAAMTAAASSEATYLISDMAVIDSLHPEVHRCTYHVRAKTCLD
jgi:hypothetical protein